MKQLRYLLKREFHLFFTNKTMLSVFFMAPIFYALLLGFTYEKGKVTDIPVVVINHDQKNTGPDNHEGRRKHGGNSHRDKHFDGIDVGGEVR